MPDVTLHLASPLSLALPSALALTVVFAAMLAVQFVAQVWLLSRQVRYVAAHRDAVPAAFAGYVSLEAHYKAADYTLAKARLGLLHLAWSALLLLGWTLLGGLDALYGAVQTLFAASQGWGLAEQVALVAVFFLLGALLELPFSLYRTFVLEQRFGFNATTVRMWLADVLRSLLLAAVLGLPLVWGLLALMREGGALWWLWAWGLWAGFQLVLLWAYPAWIAPLFNRFEPLRDDALRTRVADLLRRCGFAVQDLLVMDGSRRSTHANAYFTGFGSSRRVVLYDTLLRQLAPHEVVAVLAHELGHFHHRHIARRLLVMLTASLAGMALLGWLYGQAWFYAGLGVMPSTQLAFGLPPRMEGVALLLFLLALPVFTFWLGPVAAYGSRRDEFEADAYAAAHADGAALASALLKLHGDNAATLTPDPLYARCYYSHPPVAQRLQRLPAPVCANGDPFSYGRDGIWHAGGGSDLEATRSDDQNKSTGGALAGRGASA